MRTASVKATATSPALKAPHLSSVPHGAGLGERLETKLVLVTPAAAQAWLDNSMWSKQRTYRSDHARFLSGQMKEGKFVEGTMVHFAKLNGEIHCINGQHTLHALIMANMAIRLTVVFTTVDSEEEIADLYSRTDVGLRRTLADSYQAHDLSNNLGLSKAQVNLVGGAVRHIMSGYTARSSTGDFASRSADERVRQITQYGEAAKGYFEATKGATFPVRKALSLSPVVAVGLDTFKQYPDKAKQFWSQVAFSESLESSDPRKSLINWLMVNDTRAANHAHRARVVAHAWNVYCAGGKLSRFRTPDWTKPLVLNAPV